MWFLAWILQRWVVSSETYSNPKKIQREKVLKRLFYNAKHVLGQGVQKKLLPFVAQNYKIEWKSVKCEFVNAFKYKNKIETDLLDTFQVSKFKIRFDQLKKSSFKIIERMKPSTIVFIERLGFEKFALRAE